MCSEDIRSWDVCRLKQGMKIGDEVTCCARHRNGGAPAKMIRIKKRSRPVICANACEPGDLRKNSARSRLKFGRSKCQHHSCNRTRELLSGCPNRDTQEIFC